MKEKVRVIVLFGGQSSEHEVSRVSAQSVLENLDKEKFDILPVGITKNGEWLPYHGEYKYIGTGEWEEQARREFGKNKAGSETTFPSVRKFIEEICGRPVDIVFPVLHGVNGEDGTIQGLLELAGIPYVGCNVLSSAVGMDKAVSKVLFEKAGLNQAKYIVVKRPEIHSNISEVQKKVETLIGYPCFVKPSNAGSSVGVSKVKHPDELPKALEYAANYDRKILVEEYIDGREVECAVLGFDEPVASTVGEIIPCNEFYDYEAKYIKSDSRICIPADLDREIVEKIRADAVTAFKALDCAILARVDFFVEKRTQKVIINEINTMPGFTSISMYPKLWEAVGISYKELLEKLIELSLLRCKEYYRSFERRL
ncbi:D-alanine--D-alanine ligase Ddl [Thermoclostridium stercorarium subsp. stercorarium DSM 8532]|uniref:D-alanine--D-alanine ligase n=2 Tax=Thermoclostridium stercorarium TaxID=1510 RepID=L7VSY1_THES1|nr:D-alanine--D-alanine ligase family protein [Thermoclostridium stercorarium]AGC69491.1 D-alanine--D-alanine ligase Ddl [Thermoclostridium stercorarium subsp. stercorarium DSM 8532]AGI40444.1 Ala-Ala ligase [Thermoclostridium stercorarium subsp. stercorarium DSM 8532]ANW99732.1 D-alanine--D-alanine ligase A [Thermoclostridium stercorarium subsp. thermolacticum DSM 2910]UZQ85436.1 D-alanine--D-alanine ligase [Thermoclostridium stercorarium]